MLGYDGFRIIRIKDGVMTGYTVEHGIVDYEPVVKYRIEKECAFDPTIVIRRGEYREDSIECEAILNATEYDNLRDHLLAADELYIEFDGVDSVMQFPITVEKFPKLEDARRSFRGSYKITFTSLYTEYTLIDFDSIFGWGTSWDKNYGF